MGEQGEYPDGYKLTEQPRPVSNKVFYAIKDGGGFVNSATADVVKVELQDGLYKLAIPTALASLHQRIFANPSSILATGSDNKEEMMRALQTVLEELGNRIE